MAGLGPAMSARTIRVGDEDAGRRVALHRARADDAALKGALLVAELQLSAAAARVYTSADEEARERAVGAYERLLAARADVAICAAAIERLGGRS